MSDYLGNLAAKSLGVAETALRPRLASRFEPLSLAAPPLEVESTEVAPRPVDAPPRRTAPPERVEEDRSVPARSRRSRKRAAEEPETMPEAPGPTPARGRFEPRSAAPSEPSPLVPLSHVERTARPVAEPEKPRPVLGPAPRQDVPVASSLSHQEKGKEGEASRAQKPVDRNPLESRTAPTALRPRVTVVERGPFPARREAPAPAPIIQVTIGRIEVRATPPPAQPPRQRPAAPSALSLEDYLRQRSKGGQG
jgi:hypothetical protein